MKSKHIANVTPYIMEDHLILSLDKKWSQLFNGSLKFEAEIDEEGRFVIRGPVIKKGVQV